VGLLPASAHNPTTVGETLGEIRLNLRNALLGVLLLGWTVVAPAQQEPDHAIHEELRAVLRDVQSAMNSGDYDKMLPYLTENVEATSVTQEVMASRADISNYFKQWFGPTGYMRKMEMKLEADKLTELSADKTWGLVRGKALEHYEAKDGSLFDFVTRWTAVLIKDTDGKWRLRAIHFGTNHLDNPVLTRVKNTLIRDGIVGAVVALLVGLIAGAWWGRRRGRAAAAGA
jgi:ketosteroid isomerase-like protein